MLQFKGTVEKQVVVIQVLSMDEVPAIQSALEGKKTIHYEYQGMRYTVAGNVAPPRPPREPKPVLALPKGVKPTDFLPPPVPTLMKTILDLHEQGKGHNVQDLVQVHLKTKFPDRRGQMGNVYIQWVRRAQAARLRLEEDHGLRFELKNTGKGRQYVGQATGA